jgi:hypothetical protein
MLSQIDVVLSAIPGEQVYKESLPECRLWSAPFWETPRPPEGASAALEPSGSHEWLFRGNVGAARNAFAILSTGTAAPRSITSNPLALSPKLNPVEHLSEEIRGKHFHNEAVDSLALLEDRLCTGTA